MSNIAKKQNGSVVSIEVKSFSVIVNILEKLDVFARADDGRAILIDGTHMDHEPARGMVLEELGIEEGSEEAEEILAARFIYLYS